ncbi:hypothetical protein MUP38_04130, partial [Candidatus Bathyarchaeota archaeon]|nr:hypothetical protein [Candidatus Bathyarchaeota archaeon]
MRIRRLLSFCAISALLLLLMPLYEARCQNYIEYKVQINGDNSADWTITRVSGINTDIDVVGFQERVITLVDTAANETHREMSVDEGSLQMIDEIFWETRSRKTVYAFTWQNFSISENGKITFGDAFRVTDFFGQLYGDGALQINYPSAYAVLSVSPRPDQRDDSAQTLKWLGTEYFINGEHEIILADKSRDLWQQYAVIGAGLAVAVAVLLAGVYVFRRRKSKDRASKTAALAGVPLFESDEEKIIKILRSSGGNMRQSAITEQCRFSKAKTSQLLAA